MANQLLKLVVLLSIFFICASCNKEHKKDGITIMVWKINGVADGSQINPSVPTTANAVITGTFDENTSQLTYTVNWNGLSSNATAIELHAPYYPSDDVPRLIINTPGFTPSTSGSVTGVVTVSPYHRNDLLNSQWSFDVHSTTYTNREIKGQIIITK